MHIRLVAKQVICTRIFPLFIVVLASRSYAFGNETDRHGSTYEREAALVNRRGGVGRAGLHRPGSRQTDRRANTRAHLGQCLLRQKRAAEARPLLEGVIAQNPKHDYGYTMMALAETLAALGETDAALKMWQQVTAEHSYARAKVQLAGLYLAKNQPDLARTELKDVVADDAHAPAFQRKRDRVWVWRAKSLMRKLG